MKKVMILKNENIFFMGRGVRIENFAGLWLLLVLKE